MLHKLWNAQQKSLWVCTLWPQLCTMIEFVNIIIAIISLCSHHKTCTCIYTDTSEGFLLPSVSKICLAGPFVTIFFVYNQNMYK